jgi:sulfoxide reductase heme-binding subunit YedZ
VTANQTIRWVLKPAVFLAALIPLGLLVQRLLTGNLGADPLKAITNDTGLWTLRLLCLTLTVTPLRRLTGWNAAIRFRRMLGLFAFFYAVMHFTTYLWLDQYFDWASITKDIVKRPYITIGFTALLLLIPLAITSTNKMMRRLGRRWQTLHRLVYVITILGVWHYYWQVKKDVREPLIYVGVLALLLGYRAVCAWLKKRPKERTVATPAGSAARAAPPAPTSKNAPATAPERT